MSVRPTIAFHHATRVEICRVRTVNKGEPKQFDSLTIYVYGKEEDELYSFSIMTDNNEHLELFSREFNITPKEPLKLGTNMRVIPIEIKTTIDEE